MEKERRTKALVVVVLLIVVAGLTVAFAALSTTLNINGTAYLDAAKWGIKFKNLSEPVSIGTATTTGTAKIEETKSAEITGINVSLSTPGDKVTYTVDLVNEGTINAKIDNIEKTVLTSEQQRYLTFKVTDKNGKEVSEGDILEKGETRNLTITIEFIKDLTKEDLPASTSTISLSYKLNFVQTDDKATSGSQEPSSQACTSFDKKDTYNVGDVIALCNTNTGKSEDFYVMKDNGSTITALAKYNLLVGDTVEWNWNTMTTTKITPIPTTEEGYGLQSSVAVNYELVDTENDTTIPNTNTVIGGIMFANPDKTKREDNCSDLFGCYYGYWTDSSGKFLSKYGTEPHPNVFDSNSNLYTPLNNYKTYLKSTLGKTSVDTRLMTYKDFRNLNCADYSCPSQMSWLFSVNYWTSSAYTDDSMDAAFSPSVSSLGVAPFDLPGYLGLRPVITISKSEL